MEPRPSSADSARAAGPLAMLERIADGLSLLAAFLAAGCIVVLTGLILAEIVVAFVARFVPSMPAGIGIAWEYSAYLMGGAFLLGSGMTLRAGQQIRVELLLRAGGGRFARHLEMASCAVGSLVTVFLAYTLVELTLRTYGFGEVSQDSFTPLWIPQAVLAVGAAVLALQMIARTVASFVGAPVDRPDLGAATAIEG
jgi:TRAP-type mannitol/chloroaromatic compound transport system permease small subunit